MVADRENERIQIFTPEGEFLEQWTGLQRPAGLFVDAEGLIYVAEMAWRAHDRTFTRGVVPEVVPGHVSVLDPSGKRVMRMGLPDGAGTASFWAPHGIASTPVVTSTSPKWSRATGGGRDRSPRAATRFRSSPESGECSGRPLPSDLGLGRPSLEWISRLPG